MTPGVVALMMASLTKIDFEYGDDDGAFEGYSYCFTTVDRSFNHNSVFIDGIRRDLLGNVRACLGEDSDGGIFFRCSISSGLEQGEQE